MSKDPLVFIQHILDSIELIESYTNNKALEDFLSSVQLQDSVIRRIEIIGEAAKNLPEDFKNKYPEIPWKKIAGMRDIIVHDYFGLDLKLTWKVANEEIIDLKTRLKSIANQ